jgi:hypothetical protein
VCHASSFWDVLSDQAVGIFVSATFPRVIWGGEIEACASNTFDGCVAVEFCSVVSSDCFESALLFSDQLCCSPVHFRSCASIELSEHDVAGFSFDEAQ